MPFKKSKQYRLPKYDYSSEGRYFITICTSGRIEYLGKIVEEKIILSTIGEIALQNLLEITKIFPIIFIDEFIIMPNHIHIIIVIKQGYNKTKRQNIDLTRNIHPLIKNSVSSIINHFKGAVKKQCNLEDYKYFKWQARFHDRIIRNDIEYYFIKEYIKNNPKNWGKKGEDEDEQLNNTLDGMKK